MIVPSFQIRPNCIAHQLVEENVNEQKGEKPLRASQAPAWQANGHAKDVLFEGQYRKAKAKEECPNTKAAVLIDGKGAGSIFYLCQTENCDVHNRVTRYQPTPQEQAQRKRVSGFVLANPEKSWRHLRNASRSSRAYPSWTPSGKSCGTSPRELTLKWSASTTSGAWATTTIAVFPSSTHGKRRRAKPHVVNRLWTTRRLRRLPWQ